MDFKFFKHLAFLVIHHTRFVQFYQWLLTKFAEIKEKELFLEILGKNVKLKMCKKK